MRWWACGGRGTGAASQALSTAGATKLVALADVRPEQLEKGLNALKGKHEDPAILIMTEFSLLREVSRTLERFRRGEATQSHRKAI